MKNKKKKYRDVKFLIENELQNILKCQEAPAKSIFGKYLFAPKRIDLAPESRKEKNTPEEEKFFTDLFNHYNGNSRQLVRLGKMLLTLKKNGMYTKILSPPKNKNVYRFIHNISTVNAAKIVGASVEDLIGKHRFTAKTEKSSKKLLNVTSHGPGTISPHARSDIQSWSQKLSADWIIEDLDPNDLYPGRSVIILVANTLENDNFLLNPDSIKKIKDLPEYAYYQDEVISLGPVNFNKAYIATNKTNTQSGGDLSIVSRLVYVYELLDSIMQ